MGLVTGLVVVLAAAAVPHRAEAEPGDFPSVRLIRLSDHDTWYKDRKHGIGGQIAAYVGARGGTWEIWGQRPDYREPIRVSQVVRDQAGTVVDQRLLPEITLPNLGSALPDFAQATLRDEEGEVVVERTLGLCPNSWEMQRINGKGPLTPTFPEMCFTNPFTTGMVWGLDKGWATNGRWNIQIRKALPAAGYQLSVEIAPPYREAFEVADADATITMHIDIVRGTDSPHPRVADGDSTTGRGRDALTRAPSTIPGPEALPDLASLPAWGMSVQNQRRTGKAYLNFGATVWNRGPSPLVVEGFREPDLESMKAYQYFYLDGEPVGRSFSGRLEYDHDAGHDHWHFRDFASYALLDANRSPVRLSGKESFCLAPTDIIDLTQPGAAMRPWLESLSTACGETDSLWIREVLQAGWGDTYTQYRPGQSFNITKVPNGKYFVRVLANPDGRLVEVTDANNVAYRRIFLRGKPGQRRVEVPAYQGIDTESGASCGRYC